MVFALRFTQEGTVAAGKLVLECEAANPDLAPIALKSGGASCNGPFQVKAGKVLVAWTIISLIMCK